MKWIVSGSLSPFVMGQVLTTDDEIATYFRLGLSEGRNEVVTAHMLPTEVLIKYLNDVHPNGANSVAEAEDAETGGLLDQLETLIQQRQAELGDAA